MGVDSNGVGKNDSYIDHNIAQNQKFRYNHRGFFTSADRTITPLSIFSEI